MSAHHLPPVKYQILNCQGKDILVRAAFVPFTLDIDKTLFMQVGRLKIETPTVCHILSRHLSIDLTNFSQESGHAFILRRFDTGAISLTTMFRAAFPKASDADEKAEIQYVKDNFDLSGNNGSTKEAHITRLAGTWVSPKVALELGKAYALGNLINVVVEATPDPNGSYRRSGKASSNPTPVAAPPATPAQAPTVTTNTTSVTTSSTIVVSKPPSAVKSLPTPSPTSGNPPAKRRKESSPVPSLTQSIKPPSRGSSPSKPPSTVRRSTRTKSPAPRSVAPLTSVRTPKRTAKKETLGTSTTPGGSDLAVVDEEGQFVEDGVAGTELHDEDIREQQMLIQDLKAKRDAAKAVIADDMDVSESASSSSTKKRNLEEVEQPLQFDFKEPENEERAVVTNRRAGRFNLEPRNKAAAWGFAAFAVGMGAM